MRRGCFENRFASDPSRIGRGTDSSSSVMSRWLLNSISMALWDKRFWQAVWRDSGDVVDEEIQLSSAAAYYRRYRRSGSFFPRITPEWR